MARGFGSTGCVADASRGRGRMSALGGRVHAGGSNCPVLITLFGQARVPGHHYVIYITCALRSLAVSLTRNLKPDP